jgi:hypothetical protein
MTWHTSRFYRKLGRWDRLFLLVLCVSVAFRLAFIDVPPLRANCEPAQCAGPWDLGWATQQVYSAFAFSPEGAVVIAGLLAGSLIGLVYASPVILGISFAIARAFRRRPTRTHVYMLLPFLAIATSLIIVSELTRFEMLMQFSTSLLMLTTWALPGIALSAWALNRHRPVAG